jgi:serine/threonine protein kinase
MITGRSPWTADTIGKLTQQIPAGSYKLKRNTPPEVAAMIAKMIVVDPANRITCTELLKNPLFKNIEEVPLGGVLDCLSPLGRRRALRVGITIDAAEQLPNTDPDSGSESAPPRELTVENSRTLMIVNRNLHYGFLPRPEPAARYHPGAGIVLYASTVTPEIIRLASESPNPPGGS